MRDPASRENGRRRPLGIKRVKFVDRAVEVLPGRFEHEQNKSEAAQEIDNIDAPRCRSGVAGRVDRNSHCSNIRALRSSH